MAHRVNAKDGFAIFQQQRGGVAQILALLAIDQHLQVFSLIQVDQRQAGDSGWLVGSRGQPAQAKGETGGGPAEAVREHFFSPAMG